MVEHTLGYFTLRNRVQVNLLRVSAPLWIPPKWTIGSFVQGCLGPHLVKTRLFSVRCLFLHLAPICCVASFSVLIRITLYKWSYAQSRTTLVLLAAIYVYSLPSTAPFGFDNGAWSLDYPEWSIKLGFQPVLDKIEILWWLT